MAERPKNAVTSGFASSVTVSVTNVYSHAHDEDPHDRSPPQRVRLPLEAQGGRGLLVLATRIFSTRAGYDAHECQRSSERSDEYRRMAAADELRKRARTLRAQARRQEAAGDRAAAEATRSEVRALLRRARSALRSRGSAPTPERECNEQDRGTVRSGKTMSLSMPTPTPASRIPATRSTDRPPTNDEERPPT